MQQEILGYRPSGLNYSKEMPFIQALHANQRRNQAMKRQNPYVSTTKSQRMAKIASNPRSLAYRNSRQMVLYRQPAPFVRATPQEVNYVDLAYASYNCNTTGSITLIATIPQGAGVSQRIGKRAYYKSLLLRGYGVSGTTTSIADTTWMVVYDKRPTGALPAITDILTSVSSTAFMNDNNTGRFEIIRRNDQIYLGNSATPSTGQEGKNIDVFIKLNKRPIVFESAGTGAIGDIDQGALYFVVFGSQSSGTTAPIIGIAMRTRFTEQ